MEKSKRDHETRDKVEPPSGRFTRSRSQRCARTQLLCARLPITRLPKNSFAVVDPVRANEHVRLGVTLMPYLTVHRSNNVPSRVTVRRRHKPGTLSGHSESHFAGDRTDRMPKLGKFLQSIDIQRLDSLSSAGTIGWSGGWRTLRGELCGVWRKWMTGLSGARL